MIFEEKLNELIRDFCSINKIIIKDGKIPGKYALDIRDYIFDRLEKERAITRELEIQRDMHIGNIMRGILGKIDVLDSPIEQYLWYALEREDLAKLARRQFEIGPYKIDIAFPISKLAVECDGAEYHRGNQQQLERDQKRDKYLARKGWRTLRIEGVAIRRDINYCIERIKKALGLFEMAGASK